jgi:iron complex transport system ATP-binding protein
MIQAVNVHFGYQKKPILQNINFNLNKGNLIALVGENGSGKSTILKTLSGILLPIAGDICLNNQPLPPHFCKKMAKEVSIVLSTQPIVPNIKVKDLISLTSKEKNAVGEVVITEKKAIEWMHISDLQQTYCTSLSDGQLQRVFIARALAQDTPILLLDEPCAHLDINYKIRFYQLMVYLTKKLDKTILFSTHDFHNLDQIVDKFFAIKNLVLSEQSSVSNDFFMDPNCIKTQNFEAE